jgi:hypothetical protein
LKGELVDIVDYAVDHHKETGRAPKLAVNTNSWWYANMTAAAAQAIRDSMSLCQFPISKSRDANQLLPIGSGVDANPIEANILFYTLRILHLGIQLHFVFNGGRRLSNGGKLYPGHESPSELFRDTLTKTGVPWHEAPAEAEAECAKMEMEGLVDGVWSEDGNALAFGCKTLVRFQPKVFSSTENGEDVRKSYTHFKVYKLENLADQHEGMDREGFVLHAILNGQPKDVEELYYLEPQDVLNAAELGLGKSLCAASTTQENLRRWATIDFAGYLKGSRRNLEIPPEFPRLEHVQDYVNPIVSTSEVLSGLPQPLDPFLNEKKLYNFLLDKFQWTLTRWVKFIIPAQIVRSLLATEEGKASQYDRLRLECKLKPNQSPKKVKITYLLNKATSLDMSPLGPKSSKGEFHTLLWILRKANFNGQRSMTSFLLTPDSLQKGKAVASASACGPSSQGQEPGANRTPPTPPSATPSSSNVSSNSSSGSGSNGEGSSGIKDRSRRQHTPPSPTPLPKKRKLPWSMGATVTKNIRKSPKKSHGTSSAQAEGSGRGKAKEVPTSSNSRASAKRAQSPTGLFHSANEDLYDDDDRRPAEKRARSPMKSSHSSNEDLYRDVDRRAKPPADQPPSTPPAQITGLADAVDNIIVIDSDSDSDDDVFGSFPSVDQLPSTPIAKDTTVANNNFIMIDSDENDDETDYGSFPSVSQLPTTPVETAVKAIPDKGLVDESSSDEYGSFPESPDLRALG